VAFEFLRYVCEVFFFFFCFFFLFFFCFLYFHFSPKEPSMKIILVALFVSCAFASFSSWGLEFNYPDVADTSASTISLARFMKRFFIAKTSQDVAATMEFFHPDVVYIDATIGGPYWTFNYTQLEGVFAAFMPGWGNGKSYATRILGSKTNGCMLAFTDTPELFGGDLRLMGSLSFKEGKIVRWIDNWDWRSFDNLFGFGQAATADFFESTVTTSASGDMTNVVNNLSTALAAGDAAAAAALFSVDAVFEDMSLRNEVQGRIMIQRFLERAVATLPYGTGSSLQLARGTAKGGGYEFKGSAASTLQMGNIALVLEDEVITRFTAAYDASRLPTAVFDNLLTLGVEPGASAKKNVVVESKQQMIESIMKK
jgi:hypothetical protein